MLACGVTRRSSPPSTSAAFRASGTPATGESGSQALERERRRRGDVAEGVVPGHRGARRQLHAVGEGEAGGNAGAERGVADILSEMLPPKV